MTIRLFSFLFLLAATPLLGQNCVNFNYPTPIADSCHLAPFLCGNYLEDYCGSNAGSTDDAFGPSSGFLRLAPCEDLVALRISVYDCAAGSSGLVFQLFPNNCTTSGALTTDTIDQNTSDTLLALNLDALENYLLAVSGVQGSQCSFNIQALEGIGTALPGTSSCNCSGGGPSGPGKICNYEGVSYTVASPSCFFSFGLPIGGNGEYCPPASACPSSLDSFVLNWHIPQYMHFVGDSTGPNVVIALDTSYHGLDTLRLDSIWVSWQLVSSTPQDTLAFCECSGNACAGNFAPFPVSIGISKIYYECTLTCSQPTCLVDGILYDTPGTYVYEPEACVIVTVLINEESPTPFVPNNVICTGESAILSVLNVTSNYTYQWSNGQTGTSILVSPFTSTQYSVTATHVSGLCQYQSIVNVTVLPVLEEDLGQIATLTCTNPCFVFKGISYCQPGSYTIHPSLCWTQHFSIGNDPTLLQNNLPPQTICEGECYDFFGQQICTTTLATHEVDCTIYTQQITVQASNTINMGLVGSITCAQPCFNYLGTDYCNAGTYSVQIAPCETRVFSIDFKKTILNVGEIGSLTCQQDCIVFQGTSYCQAGNYSVEDDCSIQLFSVGENSSPPICSTPFLDCLPSNTHFSVAFNITGILPFKVNGVPLEGSYFLSTPQPNGIPYAFIVEHANGCQTVLSGLYDCAELCTTDAGKLSEDPLYGCAGQSTVQILPIALPMLAPGDVQDFVLHDEDGMIVAHNSSGIFDFDPATMQAGELYYAYLRVGPPDANGLPDLSNACTDTSSTQPVVFRALPNVAISGDSSLCEGNTLTLTASGADTYLWDDGTPGPVKIIEMTLPENSGVYTVFGTDINGCEGVDSSLVEVRPGDSKGCCMPQIPNAFTPNGDGANDSFTAIVPDCSALKFAEIRVYSRWGELVFKSLNITDRWDGNTLNGQPASSDTYVFTFRYRLDGDPVEKTEKGEITLLR